MSDADVLTAPGPALQRARGSVRVAFRHKDGETRLSELFQQGCGKARLPETYDGGGPVAVLLNTSGGITGGDRLGYSLAFGAGTKGAATSQAAEKVYRRTEGYGEVLTDIEVGEGAVAAWIPQETIVYDRAALRRSLDISLGTGARFLALEMMVLGRSAHGEAVTEAEIVDKWRIRRAGRLVYADTLSINGNSVALMARTATGQGAHALASLVYAASDAETYVEALREVPVEDGVSLGFSGFDGLISARFLGSDARNLRKTVARVVEHLRGLNMPRVWAL